jgi:hypothetical protein
LHRVLHLLESMLGLAQASRGHLVHHHLLLLLLLLLPLLLRRL